jgi:hypothetical protein
MSRGSANLYSNGVLEAYMVGMMDRISMGLAFWFLHVDKHDEKHYILEEFIPGQSSLAIGL